MDTSTRLSSVLDIRDELRRDVCQLSFLEEAIRSLIGEDVDQEIVDGMSYSVHHILASLKQIDTRLEQMNITSTDKEDKRR